MCCDLFLQRVPNNNWIGSKSYQQYHDSAGLAAVLPCDRNATRQFSIDGKMMTLKLYHKKEYAATASKRVSSLKQMSCR